ncbi:MAG: Type I Iterative PKS [Chrysothrix sp. TS-e1954]|nr:MAG: Type I Iterative PKS [Chrysothrix sp. TS-e1954]
MDAERSGSFQVKGAHYLQESIAAFDAPFFSITADEAKALDPRHRILLECSYEALENAGHPLSSLSGQDVGVFVGNTLSHYELNCLKDPATAPRLQFMGCADALLANRISYFYDFHGPSVTVDTACSSGLTALHLACQSLRTGEVKQAIVGGCQLNILPEMLATLSSSMLYSAEGKCFPFDERTSGGFGPGEGSSCVVLKPLQDALQAGDNIRAIIRNTGINQDGKTQGISLPDANTQARLVRSVYQSVGLDPTDTEVIEAHGTGTTIGDPIETSAYASTIAVKSTPQDPVYIGSSKSNFGHLEGVSGIVSIVKAAMMLERRTILPSANFEKANPNILSMGNQMKTLPLLHGTYAVTHQQQVPVTPLDWTSRRLRRVSVSNLGFGGTNGHAILEEAPLRGTMRNGISMSTSLTSQNGNNHTSGYDSSKSCNGDKSASLSGHSGATSCRLVVLSANDEATGKQQMAALKVYLDNLRIGGAEDALADLAFTLGHRRSLLSYKIAFASSTVEDLKKQLEASHQTPARASRAPNIGFIFTGQGANWQGMGRELLKTYPVFTSTIIAADKHLTDLGAPWSLIKQLQGESKSSFFGSPQVSQPACTAIQLALVDLLESFGVRPHSVTGHSSGEIGAAYAVGALSLDQCMSIAYQRGVSAQKLKEDFPETHGAMLALGASSDVATSMINGLKEGQAVIACFNSPLSVTVSGDAKAIDALQAMAETRKLFARKLHVDVAYHSPHMNLVADHYRQAIGKVKPKPSKGALFYSSLTGVKVSPMALGTTYWVNNMKLPVQFDKSVRACCSLDGDARSKEQSITHVIEIGPHSALKGPIRDIFVAGPKKQYKIGYSATLVRKEDAVSTMLNLASELFIRGSTLNLGGVNFPQGLDTRKVLSDLPPYPWNHDTEFWHESRVSQNHRLQHRPRNDLLGTLVPESTDIEPWWRNILRLADVPWLRHHKIRSDTVFPFSGYVAMAIEAASQRAQSRETAPFKIELRDIYNSQPLILHEEADVELLLTLRPMAENAQTSSAVWDEFRIFSWTEDSSWGEHCRGQVAILKSPQSNNEVQPCTREREDQIREIECACETAIESQKIYDAAQTFGVEYGPCMRTLTSCRVGGNHAMASVRVPDTSSVMPCLSESSYVVHPAFLDDCFQIVWPLLGAGQTIMHGLYLPTTIKSLQIQPGARKQQYDHVQVYGSTLAPTNASERHIKSILVADSNDGKAPFITFDDVTMAALAGSQAVLANTRKIACLKLEWQPRLELLSPDMFQDCFSLDAADDSYKTTTRDLERASMYYFEKTLSVVTDAQYDLLEPHHQKFYRLMQKQLKAARSGENNLLDPHWDAVSESARERFLTETWSSGVSGQLTCKIGENLADILLGGKDTLSLMLEHDLLQQYYRYSNPFVRNNEQAALLVSNLAHMNPGLRILEVGAGTGGVTLPLLETLSGSSHPPRFQEYVFTDISTGFFESAREKLKAWEKFVTYRKLDIENDLPDQGFEHERFDLLVAANVLHATARIGQTMRNARKLLKPGGKLLLIEITTTRAQLFPFATLSGWWLAEPEIEVAAAQEYLQSSLLASAPSTNIGMRTDGPLLAQTQWDSVLKDSGFSGVDRSLHDYPGDIVQSHTVMLSTASIDHENKSTSDSVRELFIVQSFETNQRLTGRLEEQLKRDTGCTLRTLRLSETPYTDLKDSHCIFLDELEQPMLANMSSSDFKAIQSLCSAAGVLWLSQGGRSDPGANPGLGMGIGLARSIRVENAAMQFVTLDLDAACELRPSCTAEAISKVYCTAFTPEWDAGNTTSESEYMERNGVIFVPRVVQDTNTEQNIQKMMQNPVPEEQEYTQDCRPVSLKMGTPGLLDTFYFAENDKLDRSLGPNDVEILVKASSLNFRDVLAALKKVPYPYDGLDCAGLVQAVGSRVSDFAVGDRVCGLVAGAFATVTRSSASCVAKIPKDTSFEVAAVLPVMTTTVYHSLVNIASLHEGETILIHSAAGGLGQAAIMLSQSIGAEVFATVGNVHKKALLMNRYKVPEDHIYFSRDVSFESTIMAITEQKGVDVAFSSASGEVLQATWRCLARFGRFIDLSKADILSNNKLDMQPFLDNRTYSAVDIASLSQEKPKLMKRLLLKCVELHADGVFHPPESITTFPYSRIETAFRTLQAGDSVGRIVVVPSIGDRIKIMPHRTAMSSISPEATYLITGGSGGLATSFARWLTEQGAKYIILASRSGEVSAKTRSIIRELEEVKGAMILTCKCDVTNQTEVEELAAGKVFRDLPPIKGLIHGALVHQPGLFENLTYEAFVSTIQPKVQGAWHLHNSFLKADKPLSFFVSLASISGVPGYVGDAAYAATTTFLEAFSTYRRSMGLAASTIDLGPVLGQGYYGRQSAQIQATAKETFGGEVSERELLAMLQSAISRQQQTQANGIKVSEASVSRCDSDTIISGLQYTGHPAQTYWSRNPLLSHLVHAHQMSLSHASRTSSTPNTKASDSARHLIQTSTSLASARSHIYNALATRFSTVLMIDPEDLHPDRPLATYGTDSLMAVELRSWIRREMEATVILMDMLADNTLETLTERVVEKSALLEKLK